MLRFASMMKSVDTACRASLGSQRPLLSIGSRVLVPSLTPNSYLGLEPAYASTVILSYRSAHK
jgi:hypothetical protein